MAMMAEERASFTVAGHPPSAASTAPAGLASTTSTSTSTTTSTLSTSTTINTNKSTNPTTQPQTRSHPSSAHSTTKINGPGQNLLPGQQQQLQQQEHQQQQQSQHQHHISSNALAHRQNYISPKLSALRSAEPSSVSPSHHQRVFPESSAALNPAPDAGVTSTPNSVAEDRPQTTVAAHQTPRDPPSNSPPAASINAIVSSEPPSAPDQDHLRRSATYPKATTAQENSEHQYSLSTADVASPPARRAPASRSSLGVLTADGPPSTLRTQRAQAAEGSSSAATTPDTPLSPRDSRGSQGQRELLLLKSLSNSSPPDERRASSQHRPPVSYKPPTNTPSTQPSGSAAVRVPPIRSFRSSGSRKSLTLDMNYRSGSYDMSDDPSDPEYDRTLRALEGRQIQKMLQMTSPTRASARRDGFDADDGGDVFLKIAREEGARRNANEISPDETRNSVSRVYRSHRRPLSTNVATYQPRSPPYISRRLSDQQERSRQDDDDRASEVARSMTQRTYTRDHKAATVHPGDDLYRSRSGSTSLRPSPLTPRTLAFQDSGSDNPIHTRRRSSITDQNTTPPARTSTYRSTGSGQAHGKSYNSSPLVRSFDLAAQQEQQQHQPDGGHGAEGTESTASTTAPSTVWDELDDLKSRIHRLELTGKLPPTSAAAVSKFSDERPPTATTTVTTVSSSPKRNGGGAQQNDATITMPSTKDTYPILHAALSKSKPFLSQDIFRALEAAANDAMALASMMGQPGQPGPISSGASAVGSGTTVTDRQLRRKADSICRSLTELCVALGEDVAQNRPVQPVQSQKPSQGPSQAQYLPPTQPEGPKTPTIAKSFSGVHARRASVVADSLPKSNTSPNRALSKFEERRNTILNSSTLASPRNASSNPPTPQEPIISRRSSLLLSRTRRAVTEEPEETPGRRSSLLLRTRRGGTEEPDEGRQTSMLRSRRGTVGDGEDEPRFATPSRAYTEVNATRGSAREYTEVASSSRAPTREYAPQPQATPAQDSPSANTPSALPRRRFVSSSASSSRLATPAPSSALPTRTYLERSALAPTQERDTTGLGDRPGDGRPQRYYSSLGQSMSLNRAGSLSTRRQDRDNTLTNLSTTATAGGYR